MLALDAEIHVKGAKGWRGRQGAANFSAVSSPSISRRTKSSPPCNSRRCVPRPTPSCTSAHRTSRSSAWRRRWSVSSGVIQSARVGLTGAMLACDAPDGRRDRRWRESRRRRAASTPPRAMRGRRSGGHQRGHSRQRGVSARDDRGLHPPGPRSGAGARHVVHARSIAWSSRPRGLRYFPKPCRALARACSDCRQLRLQAGEEAILHHLRDAADQALTEPRDRAAGLHAR